MNDLSPLWMVTQAPSLNALVSYLSSAREEIQAAPGVDHRLGFRTSELDHARSAFGRLILEGEAGLHRLATLLAVSLFDDNYGLKSVVIGELPESRDRFTLTQSLDPADLYTHTDLALGNRLLDGLRHREAGRWVRPRLIANFVEYQPRQKNLSGIHKMISRINAEEEIWNKVNDEIFRLDQLVERDKELRAESRFVKDVFGIKVVVGNAWEAHALQELLYQARFSEELISSLGQEVGAGTDRIHIIEVKNHLGDENKKQSGWEAIKSVVKWAESTFEIQIQPLANYFLEREYLTEESHDGFKQRRERVRDDLAQRIPLMGFYRDLLRWLFRGSEGPPPEMKGVSVELLD